MKSNAKEELNKDLFREELAQIINSRHELCQLAKHIDWELADEIVSGWFSETTGRASKPSRLIVGLFLLKQIYNIGDDELPLRWVENPYWQFFCGEVYFQHEYPIHPTSLSKWREKMREEDAEKLLSITIHCGLKSKALKGSDVNRVNMDTTVQEKAISYPTDAKLYSKGIALLGGMAQKHGLKIKQNYKHVRKKLLFKANNYARAQQMKRSKKMTQKLKTSLGRLYRDVQRRLEKAPEKRGYFEALLQRIKQLLEQKKADRKKLYSLHAPEVECIAKGKANKRFEFGVKASLATTQNRHFIVGAFAIAGNPYDGHILKEALNQVENLTGKRPNHTFVDNGYKGHAETQSEVHIARKKQTYATRYLKQLMRGRNAIEATISHCKRDGQLKRNYLKGVHGDKLNVLLCAVGYNLRLVLRLLRLFLWRIILAMLGWNNHFKQSLIW